MRTWRYGGLARKVVRAAPSAGGVPIYRFQRGRRCGVSESRAIAELIDGSSISTATEPRVLVELRPKAARTMTGSCISPDGQWSVWYQP